MTARAHSGAVSCNQDSGGSDDGGDDDDDDDDDDSDVNSQSECWWAFSWVAVVSLLGVCACTLFIPLSSHR